jgi:hypothetical protein
MTPEYIPELIAKIALADPRIKREDPIERRAMIHMWAGILADVPLDFALQAAQDHYAQSQWAILPSDIASRWQSVVRDRMNRHTGTFEPNDHPELDPDDIGGYLATLRGETRAVVLGHQPPTPLAAITAGPAAAEAQRRIAQLGDYLTTETRSALAPFRPVAAAREQAAAESRPDPYSVACPWCQAQPGDQCRRKHTRPDGEHRSRRRRNPHPSRIDLAATDHERHSA